MTLAELTEPTVKKLRALLPPAASLINPVDMLSNASPHQYANSLQILLDDPNVDGVLLVLRRRRCTPPSPSPTRSSRHIRASRKPVTVALMAATSSVKPGADSTLHASQRMIFPERAASALACLVQRAEY